MLSGEGGNLMIFERLYQRYLVTLGRDFPLCLELIFSMKVLSGYRVHQGSADGLFVVLMLLPLSQKHQS